MIAPLHRAISWYLWEMDGSALIVLPGQGSVDDAAIANPVYTPPSVDGTQTFTLIEEVTNAYCKRKL